MNSAKDVENLIANLRTLGLTKAEMMVKSAEAMIGWPYAWGATGQKCTVANREARIRNPNISEGDIKLIRKNCQVMNGSAGSCTGCKYYPGDACTLIFDCIGFVNRVLDIAEVAHYGAGCSTMWNHAGNWAAKGVLFSMPEGGVCLVFQQAKKQPNKMEHIGIYIGGGMVIHCSVEVKIQKLTDYPWTHYAIPKGLEGNIPVPTTKPTLRRGSTGPYVTECQTDLVKLGYDIGISGIDGVYGKGTMAAVAAFQKASGLKSDGICGPKTWAALDAAIGPGPGPEPEPGPEPTFTVTISGLQQAEAEQLAAQYPGKATIRPEDAGTERG